MKKYIKFIVNKLIKKNRKNFVNNSSFFIISLFIGLLIIYQYQSYQKQNSIKPDRNNNKSIFGEINLLLNHNLKLKSEIESLRTHLNDFSTQTTTLYSLQEEIKKYRKILGISNIKGPGIKITIKQNIDGVWLTDLLNELYSVGAEAISINNIRLVEKNTGLMFSPHNIIINEISVNAPFIIQSIGPTNTMYKTISQPGGILQRLNLIYPDLNYQIKKLELIEMQSVL